LPVKAGTTFLSPICAMDIKIAGFDYRNTAETLSGLTISIQLSKAGSLSTLNRIDGLPAFDIIIARIFCLSRANGAVLFFRFDFSKIFQKSNDLSKVGQIYIIKKDFI